MEASESQNGEECKGLPTEGQGMGNRGAIGKAYWMLGGITTMEFTLYIPVIGPHTCPQIRDYSKRTTLPAE